MLSNARLAPAPPPAEAFLQGGLLGEGDPVPVVRIKAQGQTPILLVCDHAGREVPARLGRLGLADAVFDLHIAYDIGAAAVTRHLAQLLDAPALLAHYSRLVIDLNRDPDCPTLIPSVSDQIAIPGNQTLTPSARAARFDALFLPYHRAVAAEMRRLRGYHGVTPILVAIHSFTPVMAGQARPWDVGVQWDGRSAGPQALIAALRAEGWCVGDNEPYSALDPPGGTLENHALGAGLPGVGIEIRQDRVADPAGCILWAEQLARVLVGLLPSA